MFDRRNFCELNKYLKTEKHLNSGVFVFLTIFIARQKGDITFFIIGSQTKKENMKND